ALLTHSDCTRAHAVALALRRNFTNLMESTSSATNPAGTAHFRADTRGAIASDTQREAQESADRCVGKPLIIMGGAKNDRQHTQRDWPDSNYVPIHADHRTAMLAM